MKTSCIAIVLLILIIVLLVSLLIHCRASSKNEKFQILQSQETALTSVELKKALAAIGMTFDGRNLSVQGNITSGGKVLGNSVNARNSMYTPGTVSTGDLTVAGNIGTSGTLHVDGVINADSGMNTKGQVTMSMPTTNDSALVINDSNIVFWSTADSGSDASGRIIWNQEVVGKDAYTKPLQLSASNNATLSRGLYVWEPEGSCDDGSDSSYGKTSRYNYACDARFRASTANGMKAYKVELSS